MDLGVVRDDGTDVIDIDVGLWHKELINEVIDVRDRLEGHRLGEDFVILNAIIDAKRAIESRADIFTGAFDFVDLLAELFAHRAIVPIILNSGFFEGVVLLLKLAIDLVERSKDFAFTAFLDFKADA